MGKVTKPTRDVILNDLIGYSDFCFSNLENMNSTNFPTQDMTKIGTSIPLWYMTEKYHRKERELFKEELGIRESGLERLIVASYDLLGLMSYLTAGEKEVRAWTIKKGTKAPQAAGKIHTDFERGFIRADVVKYEDLVELGSYTVAKEKGKVASVGKDYVMQDGDIVLFKFNV